MANRLLLNLKSILIPLITSICLSLLVFVGSINAQEIRLVPAERNVVKLINESHLVICESPWLNNETLYWTSPEDKKIPRARHSRIGVSPEGEGLGLHLKSVQLSDAGLYTCYVRDEETGQSYFVRFNLTVVRPIEFNQSEAEQIAIEGSDFIMKCTAYTQNGKPKVFWTVNIGKPDEPKYKMLPDGNLFISNVTQEDGDGFYVCIAIIDAPFKSDSDSKLSKQMKIKLIVEPPEARAEIWGTVGDWTTLTCRIDTAAVSGGDVPVDFAWSHNGQKLTPIHAGAGDYAIENPSRSVSNLHVLLKDNSAFGEYICTATTPLNQTYRRVRVVKKAQRPPTPELELVQAGLERIVVRVLNLVEDEDVDIHIDEDEGYGEDTGDGVTLPIDRYEVRSKIATATESGQSLWVHHKVAKTKMTDDGFILEDGFLPNVNYVIQVAAVTVASKSNYSDELEFTIRDAAAAAEEHPTNGSTTTAVEDKRNLPPKDSFQVVTRENVTFECKPRKGFAVHWFRVKVNERRAGDQLDLETLFKDEIYYIEDERFEFEEELMFIRNVSVIDAGIYACQTTDPQFPTKQFQLEVTKNPDDDSDDKGYGEDITINEEEEEEVTTIDSKYKKSSDEEFEIVTSPMSISTEDKEEDGQIVVESTDLVEFSDKRLETSGGRCKCGHAISAAHENQLRLNILKVQLETERLKQKKLERELEILEDKYKLEIAILKNSTKCQ